MIESAHDGHHWKEEQSQKQDKNQDSNGGHKLDKKMEHTQEQGDDAVGRKCN